MSPRFSLASFVGKVVVVVVALALVWDALGPLYSRLLVTGANGIYRLQNLTIETWADERGTVWAAKRVSDDDGTRRVDAGLALSATWEGLILLLALFLATPRIPWKRRVPLLALAIVLLTLYYLIHVTTVFKNDFHPGNLFHVWLLSFGKMWVPVLLWGALTFQYWFPRRLVAADTSRAG